MYIHYSSIVSASWSYYYSLCYMWNCWYFTLAVIFFIMYHQPSLNHASWPPLRLIFIVVYHIILLHSSSCPERLNCRCDVIRLYIVFMHSSLNEVSKLLELKYVIKSRDQCYSCLWMNATRVTPARVKTDPLSFKIWRHIGN